MERIKDSDSVRVALLKKIIDSYPELNSFEVAAPKGYGISGRNRLSELRLQFGFRYTFHASKVNDPGHYNFGETPLKRFKEIE